MVIQMDSKGEQARGIDEDTWKVKHAIAIGTNKQVGRWRGGGAKTIMREHRHKMVVGSSQYYLVITFMAFRI